MSIYARQAYLETEILQADPMRLIQLLFQGAIDALGKARMHLRQGEIAGRVRQVSRAMEIVAELSQSLDRARGGEVAAGLARLYDYIQSRLQEANFLQAEQPLEEAERLLLTLQEGWTAVTPASKTAAAPWGAAEEAACSTLSFAG